jgi:hypothetical protein
MQAKEADRRADTYQAVDAKRRIEQSNGHTPDRLSQVREPSQESSLFPFPF